MHLLSSAERRICIGMALKWAFLAVLLTLASLAGFAWLSAVKLERSPEFAAWVFVTGLLSFMAFFITYGIVFKAASESVADARKNAQKTPHEFP